MLVLLPRRGNDLGLDDRHVMTLEVRGSQVRLGINSPKDIAVH